MLSKPIIADLDIEKTRKEVTYQGLINLPLADLKLNAKQLFLETHACDYVVDPIFTTTVEKENLKTKSITIKVTGLPAKYSKIYQVDSLPKSIGELYALDNPIKRVQYLNSVDTYTPNTGVDLTFGTAGQVGIQLDYPFKDEIMRGYLSYESFIESQREFSYNLEDSSGSTSSGSGLLASNSSFSLGVMKEFQVLNRLKLRGQAGLNVSAFDKINAEINSLYRLGFRLGGALDFKVYRGISFILKGYSNVNFINIAIKDENFKSYKVRDIDSGAPSFNFNFGLRFLF
jgi:hypothetical protein